MFSRTNLVVAALSVLALSAAGAGAAVIQIDIDSTRLSGTNTTGTLATQPGFTSWDLTNVATSGTTITEQGVTFEIFGLNAANASRVRATGGGGADDSLLRDFVFNEGANGRAVGLRITGLAAGTYSMQSWHYDSDSTVTTTENFIKVEARDQGGSATALVTKHPFGLTPASFSFTVTDGVAKEIIFREDDAATATDPTDQNRARLNAFTLAVPEPATAGILVIAAGALASTRRRRVGR